MCGGVGRLPLSLAALLLLLPLLVLALALGLLPPPPAAAVARCSIPQPNSPPPLPHPHSWSSAPPPARKALSLARTSHAPRLAPQRATPAAALTSWRARMRLAKAAVNLWHGQSGQNHGR